jgi:hypothetical protein
VFNGNPLDPDGFELHFRSMDHAQKSLERRRARRLGEVAAPISSTDSGYVVDDEGDVVMRDCAKFSQFDLVKVDANTGSFEFVNAQGDRCVLTRVMFRSFRYDAF